MSGRTTTCCVTWGSQSRAREYFSLLKRAIFGTYHHVSKEHLHRYVAEREFVYNNRHIDDGERVALAIREADGKRLTYRFPG